jgi:DNA processing protein
VVVVEAAQRSGSLITARCAAEQGRSVMAVPGAVPSGRNRGAHALLRDGAGIVEDARHVIEQLQADWHAEFAPPRAAGPEPEPGRPGPAGEPVLATMLPAEAYGLEDLAAATGIAPAELMARLSRLELDGWVARVEGGRFVKAGGTC